MDDSYADQRMRNEQLVEITQVKGTSKPTGTPRPTSGPISKSCLPGGHPAQRPSGSYAEDGLLRGLQLEQQGAGNPYKFGFVGASDTHGAISDDESNFFSKVGLLDGTPEQRGSVPASFLMRTIVKFSAPDMLKDVEGRDFLQLSSFETWGPRGRGCLGRETPGCHLRLPQEGNLRHQWPRMKVRFFAGYDFEESILTDTGMAAKAYDQASRWGGSPSGRWASAPVPGLGLERCRRWRAAGRLSRAGLRTGNPTSVSTTWPAAMGSRWTPRPTAARITVPGLLSDCSITSDVGANELKTLAGSGFRSRAGGVLLRPGLENPTCRWSTWDAVKAGWSPCRSPEDHPGAGLVIPHLVQKDGGALENSGQGYGVGRGLRRATPGFWQRRQLDASVPTYGPGCPGSGTGYSGFG